VFSIETDLAIYDAAQGHLDSLIRMYATGVDLSASDYDKRTALHLAASNGHLTVVKYLLSTARDAKALKSFKDRFGNTPFDDAVRENHKEIAALL
jgi:glutaminase